MPALDPDGPQSANTGEAFKEKTKLVPLIYYEALRDLIGDDRRYCIALHMAKLLTLSVNITYIIELVTLGGQGGLK
jgi:hypothetical protein